MAKALEKTCDGIIIGAGHHGLILARIGFEAMPAEARGAA